ncbi:MAG: PH domain-containing protein [Planctomycetes bacterium]|nr:PH domain-containing protein [Planctomycetota bacterium]
MNDCPKTYEWSVHPARERAWQTAFGIGVIAAFGFVVFREVRSAVWVLGAVVAMVIALNRFFFPSRYRIDAEGVTARYPFATRSCRWELIRRIDFGERGAMLSPFDRPSPLDRRRGIVIDFGRHAVEVRLRLGMFFPPKGTQ